ncbi:hypothetical protein C2869_20570 [Saccharobesus litoralis]|uniref:STAS domain-containing protein n=1 Tax=Saccharobesus litoralis TaxID=2172099 RepID=A0A2S0VWP7_9ALTE|nr:hypothetical protein [Saccharobesus litoralis]AWB68641.1 hypothetical protein C2869_20570 [Saccharobesus litoralis]
MLSITVESDVVKLVGKLSRFDNFKGLSIPQPQNDFLSLDMAEFSTDTAGLAWLVKQKLLLEAAGVELKWHNVTDELVKLASISNVIDILGIE